MGSYPKTALLFLLIASCAKPQPLQSSSASQARPLVVVVSCDTAGWIVPCGCSSKQAGGLLRRASYVNEIRKSADVLLADAGGAPTGVSPYDRLKFEFLLLGEKGMQTAAHNIGAAEAELGAKTLRELEQTLHVPLISTNVRDDQGRPIVATHQIVSLGQHRMMVMGVLSPKYARDDLLIDDPYSAVMKLSREHAGQFDSLLVLAYLPEDELEALAGRLPEADMIVGGPTRQTIAPRRSGPTIWGATTNRGKFLVHLERTNRQAAWEGKIVELNPEFPDDSAQVANLKRFRDQLARVDFTADQTSFSTVLSGNTPKDFVVAGSQTCQKCHQNDCQLWSDSRHGHAWQTLVDKQSQMDPYCQHCHTTSYGLPGGFQSMAASELRRDVGCESCHGPARTHVMQPTTKTIYDARDRCVVCHDQENSPQFEYKKYWDEIAHGTRVSLTKDE